MNASFHTFLVASWFDISEAKNSSLEVRSTYNSQIDFILETIIFYKFIVLPYDDSQ